MVRLGRLTLRVDLESELVSWRTLLSEPAGSTLMVIVTPIKISLVVAMVHSLLSALTVTSGQEKMSPWITHTVSAGPDILTIQSVAVFLLLLVNVDRSTF